MQVHRKIVQIGPALRLTRTEHLNNARVTLYLLLNTITTCATKDGGHCSRGTHGKLRKCRVTYPFFTYAFELTKLVDSFQENEDIHKMHVNGDVVYRTLNNARNRILGLKNRLFIKSIHSPTTISSNKHNCTLKYRKLF